VPTYVCTVPHGVLTPERKQEIAAHLTRVHHEVTGAPASFVQVLFHEVAAGNRFVGGKPAADSPAWIRGDIRAGRGAEVRRRLVLEILRGFSALSGLPESDVWVYLAELDPGDMAEFGRPLPPAGEEAAWLATLPEAQRRRLRALDEPGR
jgi:4-oxalocrotonate tautomerase family enzyme